MCRFEGVGDVDMDIFGLGKKTDMYTLITAKESIKSVGNIANVYTLM